MAMLAQNEQLREFLDAISRGAQEHRESIRTQMERLHQSELEKARGEALAQARQFLQNENAKCRAAQNLSVSMHEKQLRQALADRRAQIERQAFQAAQESLQRFTEGAQYADFLHRCVRALLHTVGHEACHLLLRQADTALGEALLPQMPPGSCVQADAQIQIGGCKVFIPVFKRVLDDTLDARLARQRDWFRTNVNLCAWEPA